MKVVILAGGLGTRISEETHLKPKPMIEIGGKPILWHIMKIYHSYGLNDFVICCGYKGYLIKEYFSNYALHHSDITFDMMNKQTILHQNRSEGWKVTLVDTGENTMTGGRLKRVASYLNPNEDFCFTYGDGVSNVDISKTIEFHKNHGKLATLTCVAPPSRFGVLDIDNNNQIKNFLEKPKSDGSLINAGFFVLNPKVIDYIEGDQISWENEPLRKLANEGNLYAYKHEDFWQPMDTLRDKTYLDSLWQDQRAPWKLWRD
jgi:glucose-1-phosphate cytidylyltransferase